MLARWLWVAGAVWLPACGGKVLFDGEGGGDPTTTTGTSSTPGDVTQACLDYCAEAVATRDCFGLDDCHDRCMSFYQPSCTAEVEAMLACLPDWLTDACQITYAEDPPYGCGAEIDRVGQCAYRASDCTIGAELVPTTGCKGSGTCASQDYQIDCDDTGRCSCGQNGGVVGQCSMPFSGTEPCTMPFSCCRPYFGF